MRITNDTLLSQIQAGIQNFVSKNADLTEEVATQKKILKPSDDVAGTLRALDYQVSINNNNQYSNNINNTTTNLNVVSDTLTGVSSVLSSLSNLIANASASSDSVTLASSSQQAAQIRDELYNYANAMNSNGGYLFSGFKTSTQPYSIQPAPVTVPPTIPSTVYVYNGDNNVLQVPIGQGATINGSVSGDAAFSLSASALPTSVNLSNGQIAQYSAGAGSTINVTILAADGVTVADTFSFSNAMDMANVISSAFSTDNTARIEAMTEPISKLSDQVNTLQSDVGSRIVTLTDQSTQLKQSTTTLENSLGDTQNADMNQVALQLTQTNTALQALYSTASKILPQSLFDFLK
jgi:flagellar hook-associated protein 3 FlgL